MENLHRIIHEKTIKQLEVEYENSFLAMRKFRQENGKKPIPLDLRDDFEYDKVALYNVLTQYGAGSDILFYE